MLEETVFVFFKSKVIIKDVSILLISSKSHKPQC